jgi:glucans biosynthesis protein
MHGGAAGSGAPKCNQNALKHGGFTKEALQQRTKMRALLREVGKILKG